ncbi:MAG: hypothetical protein A3J46_00800 [Candidatus Yanofskybacteria bacterium RIFCSPHIGHO2_02_FULL_41_11]|uniref:Uncharacterized protein n=1 Tax=Candidatus Yanofskybacteria bacterium RIFCSPHIGHO2_02_FULL_41_11 TaxID=1802675 RepID=A0A1F8F4V9_9BACT|nr:MAG: hypothetical protein A3J46_00800 [Candidatus Yanofskybacteria bacterium RIFCSPHIGHO2_02_FULL_41_11]
MSICHIPILLELHFKGEFSVRSQEEIVAQRQARKNKKANKIYTNCIDCPNHRVIADPDPEDWFNDDDVAVVCSLELNRERGKFSGVAYRNPLRVITSMCRPYNTRAESETPSWCPLRK